jgi:nucleoid DNA-binding protein
MKKEINIKDLAAEVAENNDLVDARDAELVIKSFLNKLSQHLLTGERVELHQFGAFDTVERPASKRCVNPFAKEEKREFKEFPAYVTVTFKPAKALKEAVDAAAVYE